MMDGVSFRCLECDFLSDSPDACPECGSEDIVPEWEDPEPEAE